MKYKFMKNIQICNNEVNDILVVRGDTKVEL